MAYDSNKAAGRNASAAARTQFSAPTQAASNQERFTGTGKRVQALKTQGSNQVSIGPNTKGSATLKDPLSRYKVHTLPAVANPSK